MGDRPSEESLLGHADFIRRLARRIVLDEHRAEDVTQEVLLAAIRKPPPAGARLGAWLGVVARNLALRERRSTHRRQERELRAARPEGGDSVAETVVRLETQRRLVDAVLLLDEPYRSTVVQRFLDGRSAEEIARLTGTPVETVRTRIKRALKRLRARLAGDHDGDRRASLVALLPLAGWMLNGKTLPSALLKPHPTPPPPALSPEPDPDPPPAATLLQCSNSLLSLLHCRRCPPNPSD